MTKPLKALFLGAGASFDVGMPLVWELTAELKRWLPPAKLVELNQNWRAQGGGWSDKSIAVITSLLQNDDMHYEQIIGAIEVEFSRARTDAKQRQELHGINGFFLQAVHGLLLERQVKNFNFADSVLGDFAAIKTLAEENQPLWVFSTNHDIVVEMLAAKFGVPVKTGFRNKITVSMSSGNGSSSDFVFEQLSRAAIDKGEYDFFQPGEKGINLIKLHGALDIFGQGDELNYLKITSKDGSSNSYVDQLHALEKLCLALAQRDRIYATNEYTYLDSQGTIQFLRRSLLSGAHKFSQAMQQIAPPEFMSLFRGCLNYASELICIGYSFGDRHINGPLTDWLEFTDQRKLTIVNPVIRKCPDVLGHLNPQVSVITSGARDYFINLGDAKGGITGSVLRTLQTKNRKRSMSELLGSSGK